jgi:hypothetical protein
MINQLIIFFEIILLILKYKFANRNFGAKGYYLRLIKLVKNKKYIQVQ